MKFRTHIENRTRKNRLSDHRKRIEKILESVQLRKGISEKPPLYMSENRMLYTSISTRVTWPQG